MSYTRLGAPARACVALLALTIIGLGGPHLALAEGSAAPQGFPALPWVLEAARERAPEVVFGRGEFDTAAAAMSGARLGPLTNPTIELFADRRASAAGAGLATVVQSNMWIPVEISGQRGERMSTAEALSSWRRTELEAARALAMGRALAAYGTAIVAAERIRVFASVLAASRDEAAYYEGRFKQGDATVRDAKLAAVEVARNTVALQQARTELTRGLAGLAALLGVASIAAPDDRTNLPMQAPWPRELPALDELASRAPGVVAAEREASYFDKLERRQAVDAHAPFNFVVSVGRDEIGAARLGGGLAWTLPAFRRNQGERARARAERHRALEERRLDQVRARAALHGMAEEHQQLQQALRDLKERGEPAAEAALEASLELHRAGKGDLLHILTARRDLALMKVSWLSLVLREWILAAELVTLTGEPP